MESENKILMTVDTGNSVKTIADLKKEISELKKALDQEAVGSEAAKKASDDLANAQNQLKQAVRGSTDVMNIASGSYNDLQKQCEKLKLAYKSMADGIEKKNIAKKIAELQTNLKKQDAAIGDFKRNVGDYANAFGSALSSMGMQGGAAFSNMSKAGMGFKVVLDMLKAHPIIAIVAALLVTIKAIVNAFKKNEEAMNKLKAAFAPFQGIIDAVNTAVGKLVDLMANGLAVAFQKASELAAKALGKLRDFLNWMGADKKAAAVDNVIKSMNAATEITKEENDLLLRQREIQKQNADSELRISKLRMEHKKAAGDEAKQAEITKKIEAERINIAKRNLELAQKEYNITEKKAKQAPNSKEDNDKLTESYVKLQQAKAALNDVSTEQIKQWKAEGKASNELEKDLEEQAKKRKELIKTLEAWQDQNRDEQLAKLKVQYDKDLELLKDNEKEKLLLTKKYEEDRAKIIAKSQQDAYNKEKGKIGANTASATIDESIQNNLNKAEQLKQKNTFEYNRIAEEEEYRHQMELLRIQMEAAEDRKRVLEGIVNDETTFNSMSEEERNRYTQELVLANQQIALIDSQRTLAEQQEAQKRIDISEKEKQMRMSVGMDLANAIADIFGSVADAMDENNKEQFEAAKAFNIASATISTITGAIQAFMSAQNLPFPWGAIIGAIQAAAVATAGAVNIAKISQQQYNSKGSGAAKTNFGNTSASAVKSVNAPLQYSANVEGASLDEKIGDTKVIVTETDIANTTKKVNVQETENRY